MLAAILDPAHRPAEAARCERNEEVLGIKLAAYAEPTSDIALDHADRFLRQTHLLGEDAPVVERHLGGTMDGEVPLLLIPFGQKSARFHRHRGETLHGECLEPDVTGAAERRFGVALLRGKGDDPVRSGCLEQQRVVAAGRIAVRDRRQRLDVEFDCLQRILGGAGALRHHNGDRFADIAHLIVGDHRLLIGLERRQQFLPHRDDRDLAEVGGREHGPHTRTCQRRPRIDGADAAMRRRAAQNDGVQGVGRNIVDELSASAQEAQVFQALDRTTDERVECALLIHVRRFRARSRALI